MKLQKNDNFKRSVARKHWLKEIRWRLTYAFYFKVFLKALIFYLERFNFISGCRHYKNFNKCT